jgi:hypothetical protein
VNSILRAVVLVLLLAAGGVLTFMAQRYEAQNPMASVRLLTPRQWSKAPDLPTRRTWRSPALLQEFSLDSTLRCSDSLLLAFRKIPVLPVDTLRWRLRNECCGFDLQYPVSLQIGALLQTIARQGGEEWTVMVPEDHLSMWKRILKNNPRVELYPKM